MKRFYKDVAVQPADGGWRVTLDGRGIRTPGGAPQVVPSHAMAHAMAAEWDAQGEKIDTAAFPLRDLADYAIDVVAADRAAVVRELVPYAETDTLCYRAEEGDALERRQVAIWEPLLSAQEERLDVRFTRVCGVIHRPQPPETLMRMETVLAAHDAFTLAALRMLASLSASLVVALAAIGPDADADALWSAANLEEDWQAELWGRDAEAEARRKARFEAFEVAMRFATLSRSGAC